MTKTIDNSQNVIDSRDIIARIEELEALKAEMAQGDPADDPAMNEDEEAELEALKALADEADGSPDWPHGEALIRESYFTDYIEELINDCYSMPKELDSGDWPWRHVKVDYEAAAQEANMDYNCVSFDGVDYYIRA